MTSTTQALRGWLADLDRTETAAVAAYHALRQLRLEGLATEADYAQFNTLRTLLVSAQGAVIAVVRALLERVAPQYLDRLPTPRVLPQVDATHGGDAPGLGNPAYVVAGVIVAVLGIVALAWLLNEMVDAGLATYEAMARVRARAEQYRQLLQARQAAYQACLAAGSPAAACTGHAKAVAPSPSDSELQIDTRPTGAQTSSKFWWGAAVTVGALGLGWWLWARYAPKGAPQVRGLGVPRRVTDLDGSKSQYNLEVR